ncbi:MAG TPA: XRE family transcriptional regulator [Thermotogota bacterium]|nr:XRE family transcriptional regulator [Thermotogota bacterium]HPJ89389.1 XRE family transcriptional regulator [Thermotogota bacterium]HPR96587.1 XRE family transcriptional regulator [Thermotogota bacterium]
MNNINLIIAENLKNFRNEKKLSLDKLSKFSGVSKSMLGQIERGEANPSVSTVWKIAKGLKISFTELMKKSDTEIDVVHLSEIEPFTQNNGQFRTYPIFYFDPKKRFEMYYVEIDQKGIIEAEDHGSGEEEYITVFSGELTVELDEKDYIVKTGDSIRFLADKTHIYKNTGNEICRMSMIIYYSEKK